jgi:hypothetical protein
MSNTRPKDDVTTTTTIPSANTTKNINAVLSGSLPKAEKSFSERYAEKTFTGALTGVFSAFFTYFIDRINVLVQTSGLSYSQAARKVFNTNKTSGLGTTIGMASVKQGILFPLQEGSKHLVEQINPNGKSNQGISGAIAGWLTVGITNPIAVIKVMLYHNVPFSDICKMPLNTFGRGTFLTGFRDSLHWGLFFQTQNEVKKYTDNSILQGVVPNTIAAIVNQPVATLATIKKYTGKNTIETAKELIGKEGIRGLYRGFLGNFPRMGFQGAGIGIGIFCARKAREVHDSYKQIKENKVESSTKRKI